MSERCMNLSVSAREYVDMKRNYPDESDEHVIARLLSNIADGQSITKKQLDEIMDGSMEERSHIIHNGLARIRKYPDEPYGSVVDRIIHDDKGEDVLTNDDLREIEGSLAEARNMRLAKPIHETQVSR